MPLKMHLPWEAAMTMPQRILLAIGVIVLDSVVFFLPLSAFFLAYVILYNPPWFREFLQKLEAA